MSEPQEVQRAVQTVQQALVAQAHFRRVTWVMDRGFDDVAVWRTIWEQQEYVVCHIKHTERLVDYAWRSGEWRAGDVATVRNRADRDGRRTRTPATPQSPTGYRPHRRLPPAPYL